MTSEEKQTSGFVEIVIICGDCNLWQTILYLNLFSYLTFTYYTMLFSFIQHHTNELCTVPINNCDLCLKKNSSSCPRFWRADRKVIVFVWEMQMFVTHKTKRCPNVKICPTPVKGREKPWETPHLPEFQCQEAGTSLRTTIKGEAKSKPRGLPLVIDQSSSIYYCKY